MIRACLLMLAGGYAAQHSRVPLSSDLCKLLLVASVLMLACRRSRSAGCALLGFAIFVSAANAIIDGRIDNRFAGDSLLTEVRIVDFPKRAGDSIVLLVEPVDDARLPARSRVSWYQPAAEPSIGDVWQLELRLKQPRGSSNPGLFDVEAWMLRNRIQATGYVVSGKRNRLIEGGVGSGLDGLRRRFVGRVADATSSPEVAAVLAAIGVGARHEISRESWQQYSVTGTSHLMAISGLHIGLAAMAAYLLSRLIAFPLLLRGNVHLLAIVMGVICATSYAAISGFGVPAQRASLMLLLGASALLRRREIDALTTVSLAAIVVFILEPVATMAPGFSLSFSAVLLLIWLARFGRRRLRGRSFLANAGNRFRQLFVVQIALLFGLMPLTVLLFDRIAWLATPVNLVAVPIFSTVTVPFSLMGLGLGDIFSQASHVALKVAAMSVEYLSLMIAAAARLPYADTRVPVPGGLLLLLAVLPALLVLIPRGWPGRYVAILSVAALLLYSPGTPEKGCVQLHVLDVGQGLATVLQTHGSTLLFDTGASFRGGGSVGERTVVPFLRSRGIRQIDWLLVSHADIDHSGGVGAIYDYADVSMLLVGETLGDAGLTSSRCRAGRRWTVDQVHFQVLHPDTGRAWQGNDASCVLLVEAGRYGLLLTGDIEADAERAIIAANNLSRVEIVIVPHHGSATSSGLPFVKAVSPTIAIVSAGYGNRWGFPKAAVVERWQAVGATVLNTATAGAVSLRLCRDSGIRDLRMDRQERRRFWRN